MRKHIINWLVWLMEKIDKNKIFISRVLFDNLTYKMRYRKYVSDDGKWHKIDMTISTWLRVNPKEIKESSEVFVDGVIVQSKKKEKKC